MAGALKRDLGVDVETVEGHYGEFTVLVDGQKILGAGGLGFLGILPSVRRVRDLIQRELREPD